MQCGSDLKCDYYEAWKQTTSQVSLSIYYFPITSTIANSTFYYFLKKIPWFSFPSFNRKLCEATVSFFSKLSRSQTVFVLGQRVSVSMVHGRTQRVRAPFRGREKNREGKIKRERLRDIILTVYSSFVTFTSSSCIWMPISLLCNTHTKKKMGHKLIKL